MEVDEGPSTSGYGPEQLQAQAAAAAHTTAAAPSGAAAPSSGSDSSKARKGRRRRLSLDKWQLPKDENWWLSSSSEDEDEGRGGAGGGDDSEGAAAPLPPEEQDPLYDPDADAEDEKWATEQRHGRQTDAILSCPGCFTTICMECQQHAVLHTQFRAIFTMNCTVKRDTPMSVATRREGSGSSSRKRKGPSGDDSSAAAVEGGGGDVDVMYPVCCEVCGTQVGAQDEDEVVHFYHCLASNA